MNFKFPFRAVTTAAVVAATFALAGCATTGNVAVQKLTPEQMQKRAIERSAARWKALTDKRYNEAFGYLSEASRTGVTASEYSAAMQRMGYLSANMGEATCDDTVCAVRSTVTLPIYVRNVGARPQAIPVEELWTIQNGELWLIRR